MDTPELAVFIMCGGFVAFFTLLFGFLALMRWFRHKEALAMIERGMASPPAAKKRNGRSILVVGVGILVFGVLVLGGLLLLGVMVWSSVGRAGASSPTGFPLALLTLPGLLILFIGIALVIVYVLTRPTRNGEPPEVEQVVDAFEDVTDSELVVKKPSNG